MQAAALDTVLGALRLDLDLPCTADLRSLFAARPERVEMEIGFGGGERLLSALRAEPATGFIGVEPFQNGMAKLAAIAGREKFANLKLYDDDATHVLDWLPAASLDGVDIFYPDPWPKKRHWKRRFVSEENLARIARVVVPGGRLRFASDIKHYVDWTLERVAAGPWFVEAPRDRAEPYEDWLRTRYEAKAVREGRGSAYLEFTRTGVTAG